MNKQDFMNVINSFDGEELDKLLEPLKGMSKESFSSMVRSFGEQSYEEQKRDEETERQINDPHTWDDVAKLRKRYAPY